jgi:hypothetical protein
MVWFTGLPDFLEYLADAHGNLPVKHSIIGHARELETTTMHVSVIFSNRLWMYIAGYPVP